MKKIIPLIIFVFTTLGIFAQCDELFISEYVEGGNNNKAIELYNPTNAAIDLSAYSVGRFSNGSSSYTGIELPSATIAAYGTYTIVLDKTDPNGTGQEYPVWDGFQVWDYCTDLTTGDTLLYSDGDTIFCVQFDENNGFLPFYGTEYNDFLDLQGKADVFLCPIYDVNNAMYFNGNDAVALVKGLTIAGDASNIIDVVGIIFDQTMTSSAGGTSWLDAAGNELTRDQTLSRKPYVKDGSGPIISGQDTFAYVQYNVFGKNNFYGLGEHECECDPDYIVATQELNQIAFNIFPNPTTNELVIEAAENIERVEIYNLLGEKMMEQNYGQGASNKTNILVGKLEAGMYVISLFFDGDHQSAQKFIKR
jgi:hypothetical protein